MTVVSEMRFHAAVMSNTATLTRPTDQTNTDVSKLTTALFIHNTFEANNYLLIQHHINKLTLTAITTVTFSARFSPFQGYSTLFT